MIGDLSLCVIVLCMLRLDGAMVYDGPAVALCKFSMNAYVVQLNCCGALKRHTVQAAWRQSACSAGRRLRQCSYHTGKGRFICCRMTLLITFGQKAQQDQLQWVSHYIRMFSYLGTSSLLHAPSADSSPNVSSNLTCPFHPWSDQLSILGNLGRARRMQHPPCMPALHHHSVMYHVAERWWMLCGTSCCAHTRRACQDTDAQA